MKLLSDTSPEAERVLVGAFRAMSPARKWAILADLYRMGREIHAAGVRRRVPEATPGEIRDDWIASQVGEIPSPRAGGRSTMSQPAENMGVLLDVIDVLDSLGIAYAIGGSVASSIYGVTRFTADADISVEPFAGLEDRLASSFGPDYYVSVEAIRQAVRDRSTFNIINTAVGFKVDVFVRKERAFERSLMGRRVLSTQLVEPGRPVSVVTAEDSVLLKLEWFRMTGDSSEKQWRDILGVLRIQSGRLDDAYLDRWAADLGVADLLGEARRDSAT